MEPYREDYNWYKHLSPKLHQCIEAVLKDFIREQDVLDFVEKKQAQISEGKLYRLAVLCSIPTVRLFENQFLSQVCCYHYLKPEKYYFIDKVLKKGPFVRIGFIRENPIVVKWFRNQDMSVTYEMALYEKLKLLGCPLPYFSCSYRFWKDKVLLMEKLEPVDEEDDPFQTGVCVLEQLSYLHTFSVHSDIKPNNIMKKGRKYYLIDFGGVALKKLGYGYKRWNWSEKWTSQKMHVKNQITSYKNDLVELGYTLNYLEKKRASSVNTPIDPRSGFQGKIAEYMDEVRRLDAETLPDEEVYAHLKSILTK
nr:putative protein kinase [Cedratvirus duvanny]